MATILGLLLVVTFIANYLSTTLPSQMSVNDLAHETQVENQMGHLGALLQGLAASGRAGAPALQPVTLGSAAAPPFAGADGSVLSEIPSYGAAVPQVTANLSLASTHYAPPTGWVWGGIPAPACSPYPPPTNQSQFKCQPATHFTYNLTGQTVYSVSAPGGAFFRVNISSNNSLVMISQTGNGAGFEEVQVIGDHNTIFLTGTGQVVQALAVIGSHNTVTVNASTSTVDLYLVGNYNTLTVNDAAGASSRILVVGYGLYDSFTPGKGGTYGVYYTGFDAQNPSSPICPYGNLAVTDTVSPPPNGAQGTYNVTYNLTSGLPPPAPKPWATFPTTAGAAPPGICPFFPLSSIGGATTGSATVLVSLRNTYAPAAEVAFDQGAVVYVQPGSFPVMIDGPSISYSPGVASVWIPSFRGNLSSEAGIGTAMLSLRLLSVTTLALPSANWIVTPSTALRLTYTTPYAFAWESYFRGNPITSPYVSACLPATSTACTGPYRPGGPLGTVTISLPVTTLTIRLAVYSLSIE